MAFIVPFIPAIIAGIGAAVGFAGNKKQQTAANRQAREQRIAANQAAANAEEEAQVAVQASIRDEYDLRRSSRMELGRSVAAIAEAGLSPDGSSGDLLAQSAVDAELDALNIRYGGDLARRGLLSEAAEIRTQGRASARAGRAQAKQIGLLAGANLLTGLGSAAASAYGTYRSLPR